MRKKPYNAGVSKTSLQRRVYRYRSRLERYKNGKEPSTKRPEFFIEGCEYRSHSISGCAIDTRFMCIYVSMTLVVFSFEFQGIERTMTIYHKDVKEGDWVLPNNNIARLAK